MLAYRVLGPRPDARRVEGALELRDLGLEVHGLVLERGVLRLDVVRAERVPRREQERAREVVERVVVDLASRPRTTKTSRTEPWTSPARTEASTRWTPDALSAADSEARSPGRSGPSTTSVVASLAAALSASIWNAWRSAAPASAKCLALRSELCRVSTRNRLRRPSEQPATTPASAPRRPTRRVAGCAAVSCAGRSPSRFARPSSAPPNTTSAESLQIWPHAYDSVRGEIMVGVLFKTLEKRTAADSVDRPNVTPSVQSIKLPAWIMIVLSMRPKPTMSTAQTRKWRESSRRGAAAADDACREAATRAGEALPRVRSRRARAAARPRRQAARRRISKQLQRKHCLRPRDSRPSSYFIQGTP